MKKWLSIVLCSFLLLSSLPVYADNSDSPAITQPQPTVRGELAKLENANWIHLTQKQKLEDFDYLYETLKSNFPYFPLIQRMTDVDFEKQYTEIRNKIKKSKSDMEFYLLVDQFTDSASGLGHLNLFNSLFYFSMAEGYQELKEAGGYGDRIEKIADAYNNKKSFENYTKMNRFIQPVYDSVMAYYAELEEDTPQEAEQTENVTTKILEEGKIAYIKINSFPSSVSYEKDKQILFDFYNQVKTYPHVIFDFTENGGGAMDYFDNLIVAPNIDHVLETEAYGLVKNGSYTKEFMDFSNLEPISSLPKLPNLNKQDRNNLDLFFRIQYQVIPSQTEKMLDGKLWMLVSENVFSSSEYAAMFSKATKFATLVGTETGGDGIGSDPIPLVLPNSGLIVRYSPIYGITPDGASSQEFGTIPDILCEKKEDALQTCLDAIQKGL